MNNIDGRPLVPGIKAQYGHIQTPDFVLDGDMLAAYNHLRTIFDAPKSNKSGGIRPYTEKELQDEKNKPVSEFLDDLPPTFTS